MKKFFLGCMFPVGAILFNILSISFADQILNARIDANQFAEESKNIQDIDVSFCGKYGEKSIIYDLFLGKKKDVCLNLFNGSDKDVIVNIGFVDGALTNDQWKNKACGNAQDIGFFGQYVTGYNASILLKKNETKTEYAQILYPRSLILSGSVLEGCLVYSLSSDLGGGAPSTGFDIVVRKAKFITLNIKKVPFFSVRYLYLFISILIIILLFLYISKFSNRTNKGK